jgi:hypothetical protein
VEKALIDLGFVSKLPVSSHEVFNFREEYIQNRNVISWSFYNMVDPSEIVDIIITHDLSKLRKVQFKSGLLSLSVLSKKDLIAMKKLSDREQDRADVEALEKIR